MASASRTARIGVDVGGTFTDLVLYDSARRITQTGKLLTTPQDPSIAIISGIERILAEADLTPADLHSIVHGTTLVTNTIIERTGATVGLITTEGFRDTIEIGRETRYDLYDLFLETPPVLVPRARRLEVAERITPEGEVLVGLDEEGVAKAARRLVEEHGAEALAVSFMHAYRSAQHEQKAARVIRSLYPRLPLSLSSEVAPEIREYERTTTACANAYVQPLMHRYLDKLEADLERIGFTGRLYIMLSSGGITTLREAKAYPIRLIESGPAAGAMAASFIAKLAGLDRVISFDMGGTTAKICLIEDGQPDHKFDFEAGRVKRFQKGSGLPLKVSVVDMIEIGAGGGSLARVDPASGLLKVGPRSAGSVPGPVCYGRGGDQPTVTDADLVLGRLDPGYFLGGELRLDMDGVRRAFADKISEATRLEVDEAALGVQRIIDETMAAATRTHLAEKGKDPRKYTLIAFGGAGPVHAFNLARLLKVGRMVVPMGAGVASALGFLVAPPATDMVRTKMSRLDAVDWQAINALFEEMRAEGVRLLSEAGADPERITFKPTAEMRHKGQGFEIPVPLPSLVLSERDLDVIRASFFESYRAQFGRIIEDSPIEVLNWRLSLAAPGSKIKIGAGEGKAAADLGRAKRGTRKVKFEDHGWLDCPVYDRYRLPSGCAFTGPALVEERESTCVIGPGARVRVDESLNLIIDLV
ncbi:hydantoinase/oxoprolinase family protein [Rhodoligotrophos defluvii]|uniref:hydantoinase/oxoprolinase family protein n=1 Tax=Rhodoligotrophos defluvii TaxID=2561934 RepID=UPI0010C98738|nr:hydantoinase/oxoprolinase family protein [Rhodoligotrophos defluvii]